MWFCFAAAWHVHTLAEVSIESSPLCDPLPNPAELLGKGSAIFEVGEMANLLFE